MKWILKRPWIVVIAYMAMIFVLSSFSKLPQPDIKGIDKPEHYTAYGGLAIVTAWALRKSRPQWPPVLRGMLAIAITAVYGMTDEIHQRFVPGRSFDMLDWATDIMGAVTGVVVFSTVCYIIQRLSANPKRNQEDKT